MNVPAQSEVLADAMGHPGGLPGPEPTGPEVVAIKAIHRHSDGVLTFHRKDAAGEFENLFGIRARYLTEMFGEFSEQLDGDAFFSVNAYWDRETRRHYVPAGRARKPDRLRYLCAAYVDLDSYRCGLDFGAALGMVVSAQERGEIPPVSLFVRSGRGLWVLWLLHDRSKPGLACRAFPERVKQYVEVNRAAGERLAHLGADAAARDAMRLVRVPGSIHSGVQRLPRVKFWVQYDEQGKLLTYTLRELAAFFGVEGQKLDSISRRAFREARQGPGDRLRLRGHAGLNARRLREFNMLWASRGTFAEGCRNHAALVYAWLLRRSGLERAEVAENLERFAAACRPELDMAARANALRSAFGGKAKRMRDQTISDWLDVTPAESAALEKLPPASRFGVSATVEAAPQVNAEQRRQLVRKLVSESGVLSCRAMAKLLSERGHAVSRMTVVRDYRALGLAEGEKCEAETFVLNDIGEKNAISPRVM